MRRSALRTAVIAVAFLAVLPVRAEFEAGQQAWDVGRTDEAIGQWQAAAGSGDRRAMHALGRLYHQGLGVLQDYVEAHKWLNLAASRGEAAALAERDALAEKMTPAQVAEAQALARAWRPDGSQAAAAEATTPVVASASEAESSAPAHAVTDSSAPTPATTGTSSAKISTASQTPSSDASRLSPQAVRDAQTLLATLGYDIGSADGRWDARTAAAYRTFLDDTGLPADDGLTRRALQEMRRISARHGAAADPALLQASAESPEHTEPPKDTGAAFSDAVPAEEESTPTRDPTADAGPPPPRAIREAQALLAALGYAPGTADGIWGPRTGAAYRKFLDDADLPAAQALTPEALRTMRRVAARRGVTPAPSPAQPTATGTTLASADALHRAAKAGDIARLGALLSAWGKVNARDDRGWSALMHAVDQDNGPMVELLLAADADPDIRASDGTTALFIAVSRGRAELIALLKKAGADAWIEGPDGRTAAAVARGSTDSAVVAALELPRKGEVFQDCAHCPEMVVVTAGSFVMGSPSTEDGRWEDEGPRHRVTIPRPFAAGRYEVTFVQWDACRRDGGCSHTPGDAGWGRGNRPVVNVSWKDAQHYVDWLSEQTGRRYRLLSEAEWEYVARAGTDSAYYWGEEPGQGRANCNRCGSAWDGTKTAPAGSFAPNGFGLFDMLGNVWEWTEDCGHRNYQGAPSDGSAWVLQGGDCRLRMLRGGSWEDATVRVRSAFRHWEFADRSSDVIGFRVGTTLR